MFFAWYYLITITAILVLIVIHFILHLLPNHKLKMQRNIEMIIITILFFDLFFVLLYALSRCC